MLGPNRYKQQEPIENSFFQADSYPVLHLIWLVAESTGLRGWGLVWRDGTSCQSTQIHIPKRGERLTMSGQTKELGPRQKSGVRIGAEIKLEI